MREMNDNYKRDDFGYNESLFKDFLESNPDIPKGTFQIKKRSATYYWYYTLSAHSENRVKYISKAELSKVANNTSFSNALNLLKNKFEHKPRLESNEPEGLLKDKWTNHKFSMKLVNPANKRKYSVIVVGTGLAGASACATLGELGYNVDAFSFHESPRRAHSIAAQGGINAAKNYRNDGDSIFRLFYDTIKGGDYRSRESNVYRLAEISNNIIDQCVAQGVPFAREYGGLLDNRSFGGAQVSRTFYARGQTGQQLLLGAYSALTRQMNLKKVKFHSRTEMVDVIVIDGQAKGIVTRNILDGSIKAHLADAVVLATGGYGLSLIHI